MLLPFLQAMILFTTTQTKVAGALPAGWTNTGICAAEVDGRLLSGANTSSGSMTLASCAASCQESGFATAGLEYGS
jgi:hypothetical protein